MKHFRTPKGRSYGDDIRSDVTFAVTNTSWSSTLKSTNNLTSFAEYNFYFQFPAIG